MRKGTVQAGIDHPDDLAIANRILHSLPRTVLNRVRAHLEPMQLPRGQLISRIGSPVQHVYFINRGIVSLIKTMRDGRTAEVGAVGIEGVVDFSALFGFDRALLDAIVQVPGSAFRMSRQTLRSEMSHSPALRDLLQHYLQWAISQLAQTAACNRLHGLEERCCRWLLVAHDSARADSFNLTHEFLALMLGAQRAGVTLTAGILRKAGLIDYTRGQLTIVDRPGLEATTCECYATIHSQLDELFGRPRR
jgi:CRP-like cAMP-binding protein